MHIGTVAAGRIGLAVLKHLKPFDVKLHYFDQHRLPESVEKELGLTFHPSVEDMVKVCDVVTISAPLHPGTLDLFNDELIAKMKRGAYLVNTQVARSAIGMLSFVRSKVGNLQGTLATSGSPARTERPPMANDASSWDDAAHLWHFALCAGTLCGRHARDPECWFEGRPIRNEYLIVDGGKLAGTGAHSYTVTK